MSDKPKWLYVEAIDIAETLLDQLAAACDQCVIAGSLRREKPMVGDIELLYVPRMDLITDPTSLFGDRSLSNAADAVIADWLMTGVLTKRRNANGAETFGEKIKLMRHTESGIPVDLFSTRAESWANYLVCRTGPTESNVRICEAAIKRGYKWEPYSPGFYRIGHTVPMPSERAVFEFVGLSYREPRDRT